MFHIYHGDGKGKTTAAMGLALRAAGRGQRVVIAQFLKGSDTGERYALALLPNVTLLPVPEKGKFSFRMNEQERREATERFDALCQSCQAAMDRGEAQMVVLDEACAAVTTGLLPLEGLLHLLDGAPDDVELVVTGRNPAPELLERADYITEMKLTRHPYQKGIRARKGIEF